ncbi:hypothetical protein ACQ4PT_012133 [Festuca glaucescens]
MALDAGALQTEARAACDLTVDVDFHAAASQWPVAAGSSAGACATATGDFEMSIVRIDLTLNDERRMKQQLVAWAKAVASMAIRASMQC